MASLTLSNSRTLRIKRLLQVRSQTLTHTTDRRKIYQTLRQQSHSSSVKSAKDEWKNERLLEVHKKSTRLKESLIGVGFAHENAVYEEKQSLTKRKFKEEGRVEDESLARSRAVLAGKVVERERRGERIKDKEEMERREKLEEFKKAYQKKLKKTAPAITPSPPPPKPTRYKVSNKMNVQADLFSNFGFNEIVEVKVDKRLKQSNELEEEKLRLEAFLTSKKLRDEQRELQRKKRGNAAGKKATGERAALGVEASLKSLMTREKTQREKGGLKKVNFTLIAKEKEKRKGKKGDRKVERAFERAFMEKKVPVASPPSTTNQAAPQTATVPVVMTQDVWDEAVKKRDYKSSKRSESILREARKIEERREVGKEDRVWDDWTGETKETPEVEVFMNVEQRVKPEDWLPHLTIVNTIQTSPKRGSSGSPVRVVRHSSSDEDESETREAAKIVAGLMTTQDYTSSNPNAISGRVGRTLSGNYAMGENRFMGEVENEDGWLSEYREREGSNIQNEGFKGEEMTGRREYTLPEGGEISESALRRLGVSGPRVVPPGTPVGNNDYDIRRRETPDMMQRIERVDEVISDLRSNLESTERRVASVRESGVLLDTPSHVTSFGGNDTTLDSENNEMDTTGGRTFQTSSDESYEKGRKDSPTMSDGSGRSKVSGSSEERALDAAAKFLSDLSGVETTTTTGNGFEDTEVDVGEVDNEAKLSMDEIKDMIEKVEKETEQEMLNLSLGSFDPNNSTTNNTTANTSGAVQNKSSSDESNISQDSGTRSVVDDEVDKLQEVVRGLKQRNMTFEPKMDELKRQMEEMEQEKEEMEKSLRSLSNSEGGSSGEGDDDDDDSEGEVVAVMREEKSKTSRSGLAPAPTVSNVEPNIPIGEEEDDDDDDDVDDLTAHTLNSSVDTFATKSIDDNNQMKAAMKALASPGFDNQYSGEAQILSNYNLEESIDEGNISFKTEEGEEEEEEKEKVVEDLKNMSITKEEEFEEDDEETADLKNMSLVSDGTVESEKIPEAKEESVVLEEDDEEEDDLSMHTMRTEDRKIEEDDEVDFLEQEKNAEAELASALSFATESDVSKEEEEVNGEGSVAPSTIAPSTVAPTVTSTVATGVITQMPLDDASKNEDLQSQALGLSAAMSEGDSLTASILTGGGEHIILFFRSLKHHTLSFVF
ncbi:hypothetical protein TL16_g08846 [Triparma laevis f. inornata]|uniref:Uncharacterized protein n=1 Tax=Triparma laevis f. inornata TaxID=1714386 RepID=A0A9W7B4Y0_9STRA|nr:hypothetical protein TL16_g08846 [Triparma laevis f. inornata]